MPETINARELPILDIFDDKYRFEIPDYQRPYAWEIDQVGELLEDLLHATQGISGVEDVNDAPPYFMGSIVVIKDANIARAEVVDGQQRITTLTIMLCVLRELALCDDFRNGLHDRVREKTDPVAGLDGKYRLAVRKRDRSFFQKNIQAMGALGEFVQREHADLTDSRLRMFENAKHLWDALSNLTKIQRDILAGFIVRRCVLVIVSTSDQDSAYRIFAVMNDRGLDLSPTDILKARIIGPMGEPEQDKYTDKWEDIEEEVGRDEFREIFSHIRMIHTKAKLRRTLQEEFQENVLRQANGERLNGERFMTDILEPYADAYEAITAKPKESYGNTTKTDRMNELLRHLNRLDNFDWIPPAMAYFKKHSRNADVPLPFIRDLERLAYALFLTRADINGRINRYAEVLRAIEADADLFGAESPLQLRQDEKRAVVDALNGQIYDQPRVKRVGKPLLLRLDNALADAGAAYSHPVITIEHVLPRKPAPNSEWTANFTEDERAEWTGKLANLVLLSRRKNSGASNYDFGRKKSEYFQKGGVATFALTSQVINADEWTPPVLQSRQQELIAKLKEVWRLD